MNIKEKTKILIIGAPRSGTTLLAGLLSNSTCASPMMPECSYVTQVIQNYHDFLHYSDSSRFAAYAIDESTLIKIYSDMVASMLGVVQSHFKETNYDFLILKDPELTKLIDLIPSFFGEDSKVIYVVRDPRAVIASMLKIERKKKSKLWSEWLRAPSWITSDALVKQIFHMNRLISDFLGYYLKVQDSQLSKSGAVHVVRYEKIIARHEDEFRRLEEYLGFKVSREGFGKIQFDFDRVDPTFSSGYGQEIQAPGSDFRTELTHWKLRKIKTFFSGINAVYGWW